MNDRPRAERTLRFERRVGQTVGYDKVAGYVSPDLSYDDLMAIAEEAIVLARLARLCEGKIPTRHP